MLKKLVDALVYNVEWPYPGRRLKGIEQVDLPGKKLCPHRYKQIAFHEAFRNHERISIRHYRCSKCSRTVYVNGPVDDISIAAAMAKKNP